MENTLEVGFKTLECVGVLKGVWHEIFDLKFFHELVSSSCCVLGPFQIFIKIWGNICNFVFITGVEDTGIKLFIGVNNTTNKLLPLPFSRQ